MDLLKPWRTRKKKLPLSLQLPFLYVLERMLSKGLTLTASLDSMKYYNDLKEVSRQILYKLETGMHLDEALDEAGFHHSIVSYLFVVREKTNLRERIEQCHQLFSQRVHYQQKFQQTIRYPLILMIVFGSLLLFIYHRVIPSFQQLLFGDLPMILQVILFLSTWFGYSFIIAVFLLLTGSIIWAACHHAIALDTRIKLYQYIPIYRGYIKRQTSFHFATLFSSLLQTGMPIKELLHYMSQQKKLPIISYYARQMKLEYAKGKSIHGILTTMYFLEEQLIDILASSMNAVNLAKDLGIYADISIDTLYQRIQKRIIYLQPVFFIFIGAFIIFIYISLMSPMFELMNTM